MNKAEVKLIADSYRKMSKDLTELLYVINKNINALDRLPVNASPEELQEITNNEKNILKAWGGFITSTATQQQNVLFLLRGVSQKN